MPSFPAQVAQLTSVGSDLEISADPSQVPGYDPFFGFRQWLMTDEYPESAKAVGIINGDSPVTKILGEQAVESTEAAGAPSSTTTSIRPWECRTGRRTRKP